MIDFSRNLEKVCVDFQKVLLVEGNCWGVFLENWRGLALISKSNNGGRKLCKRIFEESWRGLAWISKKQYWREEKMGNFSRNFEQVCVDFPEAILVGGNYGGIFAGILERVYVDFKKQYWREKTLGELFYKFGEGLRGFPKNNIDGRKLWGNFSRWGNIDGRKYGGIFLEILRRLAWISEKQSWWEETMVEFFRNVESLCVDFQKNKYWSEETMGEFCLEIWRGYTWIS